MATEGMFGSIIKGTVGTKPAKAAKPAKLLKIKVNSPKSVTYHAPRKITATEAQLGTTKPSSTGAYRAPSASAGAAIAAANPSMGGKGGKGSSGGGGLGGLLGGIEKDATGFISHLASDTVNMAMGFPVGVTYLIEHPIAGAEGMVKATWADWSPLLEGHPDVFLHNFYEHPLGPILDVAGALTLGGSLGGKLAESAGELGEAADAASVATKTKVLASAGRSAALGKSGLEGAEAAGLRAGTQGVEAMKWYERVQNFANPGKYAAKVYARQAEALGFKPLSEESAAFINKAMSSDPFARKIIEATDGMKVTKDLSHNPYLRMRQKALSDIANRIVKSDLPGAKVAGKVIGDDAKVTRALKAGAYARRSSIPVLITHQMRAIDQLGKELTHGSPTGILRLIHKTLRGGLVGQAEVIDTAGKTDAEIEKMLAGRNLQMVRDGVDSAGRTHQAISAIEKNISKGADANKEYHDFLQKKWASHNVTSKVEEAERDASGNVLAVSTPDSIGKEASNASKTAQALYATPLKVWRYMMLGMSPRYFVNNMVGNSIMLMAATNPVHMITAFRSFIQNTRGAAAAAEFEDATAANSVLAAGGTQADADDAIAESRAARRAQGGTVTRKGVVRRSWIDKWFGAPHGFAQSNIAESLDEGNSKVDKIIRGKYTSLHYVTHKLADAPQRNMAFGYTMKRIPEYQQYFAEAKKAGMSDTEADYKAADLAARSPAVRAIVREQVDNMLGQYHGFAHWEKNVKKVIPFYSWDRAIARHMRTLITSQDYKVAMGAAIAKQGQLKQKDMLGQVPDFVKAMIPDGLVKNIPVVGGALSDIIGQTPGRVGAINAVSLSPYGTIADLTNTGLSLIGGQSPSAGQASDTVGGQLNPIVEGLIQGLTGTTTTPSPKFAGIGGPIGAALANLTSVPQVNLTQSILGDNPPSVTKSGKPTLYAHNQQAEISSFLGVPIRQISKEAAAYDAGVKPTKKYKPPSF